jgi:hypothetical protein
MGSYTKGKKISSLRNKLPHDGGSKLLVSVLLDGWLPCRCGSKKSINDDGYRKEGYGIFLSLKEDFYEKTSKYVYKH